MRHRLLAWDISLSWLAAIALLLLAAVDMELFLSFPRNEITGRVLEYDRPTGPEDSTGKIRIDTGSSQRRFSLQQPPKGNVQKGDAVRIVYRDGLLSGDDVRQLEVIEGESPGIKLDLGRHSASWTTLGCIVAGIAFALFAAWKTFRVETRSVPSTRPG